MSDNQEYTGHVYCPRCKKTHWINHDCEVNLSENDDNMETRIKHHGHDIKYHTPDNFMPHVVPSGWRELTPEVDKIESGDFFAHTYGWFRINEVMVGEYATRNMIRCIDERNEAEREIDKLAERLSANF